MDIVEDKLGTTIGTAVIICLKFPKFLIVKF